MRYLVNALEDKVKIVAICSAQFLWVRSFSSIDTQLKRVRLIFGHDIRGRTISRLMKVLDLRSGQDSRHNWAPWEISALQRLRAILFKQVLKSPYAPGPNFHRKI
jgi:hypothetical protein